MKIKVGVIFGGCSVEHEVSIITAVQAMDFIDRDKYEVVPIYMSKDRIWYTGEMLTDIEVYKDFESLKRYATKVVLTKTKDGFVLQKTNGLFRKVVAELDIVLPIVHGKGTEDGSLAGFLDTIGIPYAESSILGSALGQDKVIMKQIFEASSIPTPKYTWFFDYEYLNQKEEILKNIKKIGYPVIIKPAKLGSSVGITVAKTEENIEKCIDEAIRYDNKILVEEMIPNLLEVNCSVLGNYEYAKTSAIAEMLTDNEFLTYADKYLGDGKGKGKMKTPNTKGSGKLSLSTMQVPADLEKEIEEEVRKLSLETFRALNLSGVVRIDFLIDKKNKKVYVNEPNTIPGSLSFYLWKAIGIDYTTLLDEIISLAVREYKANSKKVTSFESNILSNYNGSKSFKNKLR